MDSATPVPIERLLEHRAWVHALARALVADEHRADDVAQDAWLTALRHPPRHATGLKSWLARLVRHRASNARRAEMRRASHEQMAPEPPSAADPGDAVSQIEELERVVRAVLALHEPYRTAIVLRFYEDLDAHQIAGRTGAPVETVRTRLKRALAQLRERLNADHGGDGRAWCAALLPLAAGAARAKSAIMLGGLAVTTKTKISLALAALLLLALTVSVAVLGGDRAAPKTDADATTVETAAAAKTRRHEKDAAPDKAADLAPLPRGTGAIVGAVRFAESGKPAAGTTVVVETDGSAPASAVTDEVGRFRFERLAESRTWRVRVTADGFAPVVVPNICLDRDETRDLGVLRLGAPIHLVVVVKDWGDKPVAGATVEVHAQDPIGIMYDTWTIAAPYLRSREPVATATTDAIGRATFESLARGRWCYVVRHTGFVTASSFAYSAEESSGGEITLHLDRGLSLEGRVVERDGRPVAGATVRAAVGDQILGTRLFPRTTTDAKGRFALEGVPPGSVMLLAGRDGSMPAETVTVRVPAGLPVEIVLDGAIVEGRVTAAADGAPIAGARVMAYMIAPKAAWVVAATTGEDGRYRLDTIRAADAQCFRVGRQGFASICESGRKPAEGSLVIEGGHATRDFVLGRGVEVTGRVTGPNGPVAGARVDANWIEAHNLLQVEAFTDADGKFTCEHVAAAPVLVTAMAQGLAQDGLPRYATQSFWAGQKPARWVYDVTAAGLHDVEITMSPEEPQPPVPALPTVRVSGRVTTPDGAAPDGASVSVVIPPADDSRMAYEGSAARVPVMDGRYEATFPLRGTKIRVRATAPGFAAPDSAILEVTASRTTFDVDLVMTPLLTIEGRLVASDDSGKQVAGARLALLPSTWKFDQMDRRQLPLSATTDAEGRFRLDGVAPGDAKLDVTCDGFVHTTLDLPIVSGAGVTLRLEPAQEIAGIVKLPDGTPLPKVNVSLDREHDNRIESFFFTVSGDDGRFRVGGLPSGTYEITTTASFDSTMSLRYTKLTGVASGRTDVEIVVEKAGEIAGRVIGPDGRPIAGVSIGTMSETGDPYTPSARSGDDGAFVIRGLGTGTYQLDARPPETRRYGASMRAGTAVLAARLTGVAPGTRDVEIRMPAGAAIRGTLVNSAGAPLVGAWVRADLLPGQKTADMIDNGFEHVGAATDAEGRFVLVGLFAARYRLIHVPDASDERVLRPLRGGDDVTAGTSDVRLVAGGVARIAGVVVDEQGNPAAEAGVGARPVGGGPGVLSRTLADGTFALDGVSDLVKYVVSAAKGRVLKGDVENVAPGATGVRVQLTSGLDATGRVLQKDGTPFAKGHLEFTLEGDDFQIGADTDADGRFTAKSLRPGTYRVEESLSVMRPGDHGPRPCGTIRAGEHDVELKMAE